MKKVIALLLVFITVIGSLAGCSLGKDKLVGKWYNSKEQCLDIRSDNTFKLDGTYGTGTWKKLDDGTYEFLDFYGGSLDMELCEGELGEYIDFDHYGDFYRDAFPKEGMESQKIAESEKAESERVANAVKIEPFEGIKYEVTGVSPYCKISVNIVGCSKEAQQYVAYKLDKDEYANGDKVTLTAALNGYAMNGNFILTDESYEFTVSDQPEYLYSLDGVDTTLLEKERDDFVNGETAAAVNQWGLFNKHFGWQRTHYTSIDKVKLETSYLLTKKLNKESSEAKYINQVAYIYTIDATLNETVEGSKGGKIKLYVCVSAYNVVQTADGSLKWGLDNPDMLDFKYETGTTGVEDLIATSVTAHSADYNIEKIS